MKKLYFLLASLFLITSLSAQNVLLFENFEDSTTYNQIIIGLPTGNDNTWIDADFDFLADQSGANRPGEWFLSRGFADVDTTNTVMASNSWTLDPTPVQNYLILPPIQLTDTNGMFYWKSAPRQTPRFLDGMQVLVSTTGNFPENFTDTLKRYAEYLSGSATATDSSFANYVFSNGFVFGLDNQYLEYHNDSARFIGILRPDSASLSAYNGQTIYLAFCHGTVDDNLISVDDIKVTGTGNLLRTNDVKQTVLALSIYPNPTNDQFRVSYQMQHVGQVKLNMFDLAGRFVKSISNSTQINGSYYFDVDTRDMANGLYNVVLQTAKGISTAKVTVQH